MTHQTSDKAWYLGIDLGTGSCKSTIINSQGSVLGLGTGGYRFRDSGGMGHEQDPESLVSAMVQSVRTAIKNAQVSRQACQAISITGAYHSLMAVDHNCAPLTGLMTWVDERPSKQAQAVRESSSMQQSLYQQTGCPVHTIYPLYKLIWMREKNPDVFHSARRFISGKEYVLERLTGEYIVDYGIAAGSGLLNIYDLDWNKQSLDLAGITPDQLSPLVDPRLIIHKLNPEIASAMGIPANTKLVIGSADAVNSSLGAGAVLSGQATCMIGTSGGFRIISPKPMIDPQARSWCYAIDKKHWLVGGAINNGGLALSWLHDITNKLLSEVESEADLSFEELISMAAQVEAGAQGLICLPFFTGERSPYWNMNAKGVFFGLTLHHDISHMVRALLEGVAFRMLSLNNIFVDLGAQLTMIRASGGFTHSELWTQIMANVLNHKLEIPVWGETSSLGTAFWALMGTGVIDDFEDLNPLVQIEKSYLPNPEDAQLYGQLYKIYMDLYHRLVEPFDQISSLTSNHKSN